MAIQLPGPALSPERALSALTEAAMRSMSRRGLLRAAGAAGVALIGLSSKSPQVLAGNCIQDPPCPSWAYGFCNYCFSHAESGGFTCDCSCDTCACGGPVYAVVEWWVVGTCCTVGCACAAC
jgi:hypothetical protein